MDELRWEYLRAARGLWHDMRGHVRFLYETAASYEHPVIAEMGVRSGMSTRAFLLAARERGGFVWSVDTQPPGVPLVILDHPQWRFFRGDDLCPEAREFIPPRLDVLFLDAHDDDWSPARLRAHVLTELRTYVPRLKPGGVALLHDTQWEPPATDLGKPAGDVARALDEYCAETGLSWVNREGFYGLGVLQAATVTL